MKGDVSEFVGIIGVFLITFVIVIIALIPIISSIIELLALSSPENVARQFAGFIAAIASTYSGEVVYVPSKDLLYSIDVRDYLVKIDLKSAPRYAEKTSATHSIVLDLNYQKDNVNKFIFRKKIKDGNIVYEIEGE